MSHIEPTGRDSVDNSLAIFLPKKCLGKTLLATWVINARGIRAPQGVFPWKRFRLLVKVREWRRPMDSAFAPGRSRSPQC